jgi:hypothetical protein
MAVYNSDEIPGVSVCTNLKVDQADLERMRNRLTAKTYFKAGCSRSRSCSWAMSSNREGLSESGPVAPKNSIVKSDGTVFSYKISLPNAGLVVSTVVSYHNLGFHLSGCQSTCSTVFTTCIQQMLS